jgi:hypothetical protein
LLPAETATALIPGRVIRQQKEPFDDTCTEPSLASTAQAGVQVYELDYHDHRERHGFFFALGDSNGNNSNRREWSSGGWSSDADVLYCRSENGKLAQLVVIGGTHVAWQERPLLQAESRSEFFEWRRQDGVMNSAPAGFSRTALFEEMATQPSPTSSPYAEKH